MVPSGASFERATTFGPRPFSTTSNVVSRALPSTFVTLLPDGRVRTTTGWRIVRALAAAFTRGGEAELAALLEDVAVEIGVGVGAGFEAAHDIVQVATENPKTSEETRIFRMESGSISQFRGRPGDRETNERRARVVTKPIRR